MTDFHVISAKVTEEVAEGSREYRFSMSCASSAERMRLAPGMPAPRSQGLEKKITKRTALYTRTHFWEGSENSCELWNYL